MDTPHNPEREPIPSNEDLFEEYLAFLLDFGEWVPDTSVHGSYYFVLKCAHIPTTSKVFPHEVYFSIPFLDNGEAAGDYVFIQYRADQDALRKNIFLSRQESGGVEVEVDYEVVSESPTALLDLIDKMEERDGWSEVQKNEWWRAYILEDRSASMEDIALAKETLEALKAYYG